MRSPFGLLGSLGFTLAATSGALLACDGSGLAPASGAVRDTAPDSATTPDASEPETTPVEVPVDDTVFDAATPLEPVAPTRRPLPSGLTEGATIVVARTALEGRFLYGIGADPGGTLASLGGGAAGLMPLRSVVELMPNDPPDGAGAFVIRALDPATGLPVDGDDGVIETYAYQDVDAETVRVDFSKALAPIEIAVYGTCRFEQSSYELHAPPVYADGLLTWPADEVYARAGQCQWVPRQATGLHVHYLRHALAGRDFVPRAMDARAPFGFFLDGSEDAPLLARLPGIALAEPERTFTYYLHGFPDAYVPAARETFEAWNDVLEQITGRRPFAVEIAPADMIAWDPRFQGVVWDETGSGGAVAPFTEDPDTGEIFQSFVVMWFGGMDDLVATYEDFFDQHPDIGDALLGPPAPTPASIDQGFHGFDWRQAIARQVRPVDAPARALTLRPFVMRPLDREAYRRLARDYDAEQVTYTIVVDFLLHELGHNLGLRHNFIGSVDKHRFEPTQTSSTTMDYVIGMLDPGSYDRDAMRYGYGDAPPESEDYLYCTDETTELEPACIQWDYGNPVRYQLDVLDGYMAAYPPEADANAVQQGLQGIDPELNRARKFINTGYESWDETPIATFDELLDRVDCKRDCPGHVKLRSALALYLLYSRYQTTAYWEPDYPTIWIDFPALDETQSARLMDTFFDLIVARGEPLELKTTIVGKLPTSAVSGAKELLITLHDHFASLEALTGDDVDLKAAIDAAYAQL